jgi:phosphatidylglycerol---prolipoprotein diacylglyceryl transferase
MVTGYIHWNINPEIFNLFGISVRYYGALFVTGLIICYYMLQWIYKREDIPVERLEKFFIYGFVGILAGARLGHCLFYEPGYYFSHPLEMILPIQSLPDGGYKFTGYQGLASHGGTIGLIIAIIWYCVKTKESLIRMFDMVAVVAPIGACFIRLANLMNSEIIGIPTTVPWAFIFEKDDNLPRHPAQLYEAIAYVLIFVVVFYIYKKRRDIIQKGILFGLTITLIFSARFVIEFLKEKQVKFEEQMKLDMGQLLSIPLILLGITFIVYGIRKMRKTPEVK